jgi:hypothetical protein
MKGGSLRTALSIALAFAATIKAPAIDLEPDKPRAPKKGSFAEQRMKDKNRKMQSKSRRR